MNKIPPLALLLVAIGLGSLVVGLVYTAYNVSSSTSWTSQRQNQQGMMGGLYQQPQNQSSPPISLDQAKTIALQYLSSTQNPNLAIKEIMEFQYNFYAEVAEISTGIHAFELLVNKYTAAIAPEPGPNMMWNAKYSTMGQGMIGNQNPPTTTMTVTKDKALQTAQTYLDTNLNGA